MRSSNGLLVLVASLLAPACTSHSKGDAAAVVVPEASAVAAPAIDAGAASDAAPAARSAPATKAEPDPPPADVNVPPADAEKNAVGVASVVLRPGTGAVHPQRQDTVKIRYIVWTERGKRYDKMKDGPPEAHSLRRKGIWSESLKQMVVGEKRRFWFSRKHLIDSEYPVYMPVFDIELVEIVPGRVPVAMPAELARTPKDAVRAKGGLAWKTTRNGTGAQHPSAHAYVTIHYSVWTPRGEMLASTRLSNESRSMWIDQTSPIWKQMLRGMVAGEKRVLWWRDKAFSRDEDYRAGDVLVEELELVSFVEPPETPKELGGPTADAEMSPTGLRSKRLIVGTGTAHPRPKDVVEIHFSVWTEDGKLFTSSILSGRPARLLVANNVPGCPDFPEGVQLMVVGEKRRFWIPEGPPYQGTDERARPPNGKRVCDIELFAIGPPPP